MQSIDITSHLVFYCAFSQLKARQLDSHGIYKPFLSDRLNIEDGCMRFSDIWK